MNQKKAKQIRRMANEMFGETLEQTNYGARQNSQRVMQVPFQEYDETLKQNVTKHKSVHAAPNGTIELGQCVRKVYQEMKKQYKNS